MDGNKYKFQLNISKSVPVSQKNTIASGVNATIVFLYVCTDNMCCSDRKTDLTLLSGFSFCFRLLTIFLPTSLAQLKDMEVKGLKVP